MTPQGCVAMFINILFLDFKTQHGMHNYMTSIPLNNKFIHKESPQTDEPPLR